MAQPWPEDDVRGDLGRAPERQPVPEQVPQGRRDDVHGRPLGRGDHDDAGSPTPGDDIAQQAGELLLVLLLADRGRVVGDLVEDGHDQLDQVGPHDLAAALAAQPRVPVVHLCLQCPQPVQGVGDVVADEHLGHLGPQAQLDLLAVEQPQPAVRRHRRVGDDVVQRHGLAAARLTADEHVAVDQLRLDPVPVLVQAEEHPVEHRQPRDRHAVHSGPPGLLGPPGPAWVQT